jgi:hypothetical protein
MYTPEQETIQRDDHWVISWGPLDGERPVGRVYAVQLAELDSPSHVTILHGVAYVFWNCRGTTERAASMGCEDLFMFFWWPAVDEFNDPLPEYSPSDEAWEQIRAAQVAALEVEDTEEAWHRALVETWRDTEPETFHATCDLFTDGQRTVLAELGAGSAQYCISSISTDSNGAAQAVRDLGLADPPRDEQGSIDYRAWTRLSPNDLIAVCRLLGY